MIPIPTCNKCLYSHFKHVYQSNDFMLISFWKSNGIKRRILLAFKGKQACTLRNFNLLIVWHISFFIETMFVYLYNVKKPNQNRFSEQNHDFQISRWYFVKNLLKTHVVTMDDNLFSLKYDKQDQQGKAAFNKTLIPMCE
jgi:hypothetical protein